MGTKDVDWWERIYYPGALIVGGLVALGVFLGSWWYAIHQYGWYLGIGLGWLPAIIIGLIAGFFAGAAWPLVLVGGLVYMVDPSERTSLNRSVDSLLSQPAPAATHSDNPYNPPP